MKNPNPVNLQTSASIRNAGWQAETRDADGHLCRTHAPFETDEDIVWLVREALEHGETVTIWPSDNPPPAQTQPAAADAYVAEKGFEHSGGIIEEAFEAGARWATAGFPPYGYVFGGCTFLRNGSPLVTDHIKNHSLPVFLQPAVAVGEVERLREALSDLERYVSLECYDQWLPDGHAKTSVLTRKLDTVRAALHGSEKGE